MVEHILVPFRSMRLPHHQGRDIALDQPLLLRRLQSTMQERVMLL